MTAAPSFSLAGKTALVTGASSGLGYHFAGVLSRAGAVVVIAARRVDRLERLAAEIKAAGGTALAVPMDVTDPASVASAFDTAQKALGPIGVVINNAGVPSHSCFLKTSEEEWRGVMAVNLDGVFRVGQEAAQRMVASGTSGSIINIASILGMGVSKTLAPYSATKAAVISLTKSMALELARSNIRVNAIAPGYFATEINGDFWSTPPGIKMVQGIPFGRIGKLNELDGPLLLLASDAGSFMTGSVLTVDGGHILPFG
jgi:NAD(P)-dependent dehydrogenase (short-subunit alcohol dehydrogenase family)